MTRTDVGFSKQLAEITKLEDQLAAALMRTADELAHTECFDDEQRAEVYTILDAMRSDSDAHRRAVGQWVSDQSGERSDV